MYDYLSYIDVCVLPGVPSAGRGQRKLGLLELVFQMVVTHYGGVLELNPGP